MTRPDLPFAAPYRTSATPAASASLTNRMSRPSAFSNSFSASSPLHFLETFAGDMVTPGSTTAGKQTPTASPSASDPSASIILTTSATTSSGLPPSGVGTLVRSVTSSPVSTSTMAPLMPVPPMSMPMAWLVMMSSRWCARSRQGQDLGAALGDDQGVFELSGQA